MEIATLADAPVSVLLIDLDHFLHLNHKFTHTVGDDVLCNLARFLEQNAYDTTKVFRNSDFAILLPGTAMSKAKAIAEQIRKDISETIWSSHAITVSIGMVSSMPEQTSWRDLIDEAEAAVREAKMAGGNCVRPA